ncbi:MAG: phosphodiester glycosidase family protein [Clostridia bacterium]|nr:phosphodiester glycosidase family protein [Clostridia bacterium]
MKRFIALLMALITPLSLLPMSVWAEKAEEIVQESEKGYWSYQTEGLTIVINRREDDTPRVWYEAEIWASEAEPLTSYMAPAKKAATKLVNPQSFAKENHIVLAITDDFCGYRIRNKHTIGIVIRNGQVLGKRTRNSKRNRGWPNLDTLAVLPDGSMKAAICDAYTADEYLAMGAKDVFAFGPVLLSDGQFTDYVMKDNYYPYHEPRMAIGMIEPYHYLILSVEGREDGSKGARLDWMAEKMKELGCTEALNLDGGGTAAMIFMGEVLNRSEKGMRSVSTLIGFGQSSQVSE